MLKLPREPFGHFTFTPRGRVADWHQGASEWLVSRVTVRRGDRSRAGAVWGGAKMESQSQMGRRPGFSESPKTQDSVTF